LGGSVIPVLVGSAVARSEGAHDTTVTVVCLVAAMLLQIGTNLANDALDFSRGIDTEHRIGPTRMTQAGLLSYRSVVTAAVGAFVLAVLCGVYLAMVGGIPIIVIGVAAIVAAVAYSGGPFPLSSHGLGEAAAFVFFGLVAVVGTAYLHTGRFGVMALMAGIPVGALISCLMIVNNLRDIDSDAAAGKRTLPVRLGAARTLRLHAYLVVVALVWPVVIFVGGDAGSGVFLCVGSVLLAVPAVRHLRMAETGEQFNRCLAESARLHAVYGLLLALGFLV
jgi:1,4-dihydroxy-2-naphthoate octaprenyltransferase